MTVRKVQDIYKEAVKLYNRLKEIDRELEKDFPNVSEEAINDLSKAAWCFFTEIEMVSGYLKDYREGKVDIRDIRKVVCSELNKITAVIRCFNPQNKDYPAELK